MDEVRIWNIARTLGEIRSAMYCELNGNEVGLVGYWKFNETSGSIAYNSSPYGNHASLQGGAVFVSSTAPFGGSIVRISEVSQRSLPSELVDIQFDLSNCDNLNALVGISLVVSSNGGRTWSVPVAHVYGDVGSGIQPGLGKTIIWNAGLDWPGHVSDSMRVKVIANDD